MLLSGEACEALGSIARSKIEGGEEKENKKPSKVRNICRLGQGCLVVFVWP